MVKVNTKNQGTNHLDEILTWCEDKLMSLEKATDKPLLVPIYAAMLELQKQVHPPKPQKPRRRAKQAA